jgi:hypothetical protein
MKAQILFKFVQTLEVFTFPPFSGQTPVRLCQIQPLQNANFLALELLELSGDFPVTFQCMLARLVNLTDFPAGLSIGISPNEQSNSTRNNQTAAESPTEVQQTPSRQPSLLVLLIKNKN